MSHDGGRSSSSEDETPVESLIQGRAKRSTAGLNMSALVNAEADDDLALLFEEVDDDGEFSADAGEEGGEDEEMGLDSSSDDDDQGPSIGVDDLEGEKQLEKEEKEAKKKRRAREDLRYKIVSKKVKIDPTALPATPAPRSKKKSERVSWIPTPEDGPTRSSSRRQTMQNKELTHARLKDSEEKRIRLIATMEEAAKRKAKLKPKEMTQAERLAEAERVERLNSKSLNRWEEMEKRKAEERRAKIEALQNRRLEGPVMSYWSGVATWVDGRLTRVGKVDITPKPEKEDTTRKKSKKADKEAKTGTEPKVEAAATEPTASQATPLPGQTENPTAQTTSTVGEPKGDQAPPLSEQMNIDTVPKSDAVSESSPNFHVGMFTSPAGPSETPTADPQAKPSNSLPTDVPNSDAPTSSREQKPGADKEEDNLATQTTNQEPKDNIQSAAVIKDVQEEVPKESSTPQDTLQPNVETLAPQDIKQNNQETPLNEEGKADDVTEEPSTTTSLSVPQPPSEPVNTAPVTPTATIQPDQQRDVHPLVQQEHELPSIHVDNPTVMNEDSVQPPPPRVVEHTGRCLTVLENFDEKTAQSREFSIYFNAKKPPRLTKISSSLCVITSLPSRYRDPETSLPFANSYAYHEIHHTASQKYSWSPMMGCYVGPSGVAARGVPARFLGASEKDDNVDNDKTTDSDKQPATSENDKDTGTKAVSGTLTPAPPVAPAPAAAGSVDAMEIDKCL